MVDTKELAEGYTLANNTQYNAGLFLLSKLDIQPGMRVLDVACSPGNLTAYIARLVGDQGRVVGIDLSMERLASGQSLVRNNKALSFFQGKAEDLSRFERETFDVVFINSTLQWFI